MKKKFYGLQCTASLAIVSLAILSLVAACSSSTGPENGSETIDIVFEPAVLDLGEDRQGVVSLENIGSHAVGPIQLQAAPVTTSTGAEVAASELQVTPQEIPTLNPGSSRAVTLSVVLGSTPQSGSYNVSVAARSEGALIGTLPVSFQVAPAPPPPAGATIAITSGPSTPRQGDVVGYQAEVRDSLGKLLTEVVVAWTLTPASAGLVTADGNFVGYAEGPAQIIAAAGEVADTMPITVESRGLQGSFAVIGQGALSARFTSDVWVHGDHAYTGTWSCRNGACGDRLYVWDVSSPDSPSRTDSVLVDARVVNDVKIRADGALGVISHEGSNDGLNGVTLLDLSDRAHPSVLTRFTSGLTSGIHNVWVDADYLYVVVDGIGSGLRVLDISNPASPAVVASYYAGGSFLHDVYVRDGLAFLSHWNAGLVILDVGNGVAGGSPASPVEVSRISSIGGQTHNAWYWPGAGYVFVGEEDFGTPGIMHVVDVRDLADPKEIATFRVAGATPHNFWLDEERAILYAAWYENGLRAIDVSGELLGSLDRQGREIASILYGVGSGCAAGSGTCTWAPQLHDGLLYLSDMNTGLWALRADF